MGGRKEKGLLCVCRAKFTQQEKVCLPEETGTETSPHILTEFSHQSPSHYFDIVLETV